MIASLVIQIVVFVLGALLVGEVLLSALQTIVLPRSARDRLAAGLFLFTRKLFDLRAHRARSYTERDRIMALYAPTSLLLLPVMWLTLVAIGYTGMFWSLGVGDPFYAFEISGSSLLTLGFASIGAPGPTALSFTEAGIGLTLAALLIAYLPTMYTAFSRREAAVSLLEVRAGSPPSAGELILRYYRIQGLDQLHAVWVNWEVWFADIEETHTSLAALTFFRSPQPDHSWVTASGAILDAAALVNSSVDVPHDPQADLCLRAGYLALREIADFFRIPYDPDPAPTDPISITRAEFDEVYDRLCSDGVPMKPDRDQAWRDFAGWRVNYDAALLGLAALTMAPEAPWSSDRSLLPSRQRQKQRTQ